MKPKHSKKPGTTRRTIAAPVARLEAQKILATTDFSGQSLPAIRYALALGGKIGATVTLLHVVETAPLLTVLARTDSEVAALAQTQLEALVRREADSNVKVSTAVRKGKPFHEIVLAAGERAADLIVIATHGHTGLKRVWLGSTAERVVRHAPCAVLAIPNRKTPSQYGKTHQFKIKRILVPIDFSNLSLDALPWAIFVATQFGAELILLHVVERNSSEYVLGQELMSEALVPLLKQAESDLEGLAVNLSKSAGLNVSATVREGTPFEGICQAAKTLDVDMIAMTTHGYTGLKHVLIGSTAERVVRHASCPVLAVRELKRKTL